MRGSGHSCVAGQYIEKSSGSHFGIVVDVVDPETMELEEGLYVSVEIGDIFHIHTIDFIPDPLDRFLYVRAHLVVIESYPPFFVDRNIVIGIEPLIEEPVDLMDTVLVEFLLLHHFVQE